MKKALAIFAGALLAAVPLVTANVAFAYLGDGDSANPAFWRCPWPRTCMAPCILDAPAQVLCKYPDGKVRQTSFACCCCGSGLNSYKPLPVRH
jgi:hypothetical protein